MKICEYTVTGCNPNKKRICEFWWIKLNDTEKINEVMSEIYNSKYMSKMEWVLTFSKNPHILWIES